MINLPIRELIMYKNGVSFFVREGAVSGREVRLVFKTNDINDVLKSLTVFDRSGGMVTSMSYQTPRNPSEQGAFNLSEGASLQDIVRDLRGREVTLSYIEDDKVRNMGGFVIGTEASFGINRLLFMGQDGLIRFIPVDSLRSLKIVDNQTTKDLAFFLDKSRREESRCIVNIQMSEGEHQLVAFYTAPSPLWRVSYRLIAQADKNSSSGRATLQGWGIFDNQLEEDLENVRLTLVAGHPVSFVYDLYNATTPKRIDLSEKEVVAPTLKRAGGTAKFASIAGTEFAEGRAEYLAPLEVSFNPDVTTRDAGDAFQYQVTTPVSVKRGESALVPILNVGVQYQRQLLYNPSKHGAHPMVVLAFENNSVITLDRGPVTVIEDGVYRGETMLDFTKPHEKLYLPFSVEQAVVVRHSAQATTQFVGLRFDDTNLIEQVYDVETVTLWLENKTNATQTILLEVANTPIRNGYELFDTPAPETITADVWRWRVPLPTKGVSEWRYKVRRLRREHIEGNVLSHAFFQQYLSERRVDEKTYERLLGLMELYRQLEAFNTHLERLHREREDLYRQQQQWRENLGALKQGTSDDRLRGRFLKQLEDSEDRLENIQRATRTTEGKAGACEKQIIKMLKELN